MRRPGYILLPVLCLGWLLSTMISTPQLRSQNVTQPERVLQFRVIVGLTDSAAKPWQGEIAVSGATLDSLSGWRFSQDPAGNSVRPIGLTPECSAWFRKA
jgi:hypothetical protein